MGFSLADSLPFNQSVRCPPLWAWRECSSDRALSSHMKSAPASSITEGTRMPAPPGQPALIRGWGVACEEVSSAYESSNLEDNGFVSPAPAGRPSSGSWMSHDLTFFRNGVHSLDFRLLIYEVDTLPPYHPQHGLMVSVGVWSGPTWRAAPPLGLSPEIPLVLNSHVFGDFSQKPE